MKNGLFKILSFLFLFSNSSNSALAQAQGEAVYIHFDGNSEEVYWEEGELEEEYKAALYLKNISSNGDINFYVKGNLLKHDVSKMDQKKLAFGELEGLKVISANELEKHISTIQEKYPLGYNYGSSEYPVMYIMEETEGEILMYEVLWRFYNRN